MKPFCFEKRLTVLLECDRSLVLSSTDNGQSIDYVIGNDLGGNLAWGSIAALSESMYEDNGTPVYLTDGLGMMLRIGSECMEISDGEERLRTCYVRGKEPFDLPDWKKLLCLLVGNPGFSDVEIADTREMETAWEEEKR